MNFFLLVPSWAGTGLRRRALGWLCALALACVALPSLAQAPNHLVSTAWLEDPQGRLTVQDVAALPAERLVPYTGHLTRGYTASALWLRLQVRAPEAAGDVLMLRIRPTFLDDVRLYLPDVAQATGWRERRTGDLHPFADSERGSSSLSFLIAPPPQGATYWLRVQTDTSNLVFAEVLTVSEARAKDARLSLLQLLNFVIISGVALWAWTEWRSHGDSLSGWFALYQVTNALYLMLNTGQGAALEPGHWPGLVNQVTNVATLATVLFAFLFHRAVLSAYGAPRWAIAVAWLIVSVSVVACLTYLWGAPRLALALNAQLALVGSTLLWLMSFALREPPAQMPHPRLLQVLYGAMALIVALAVVPYLGWNTGSEWILQSNLFIGVVTALLMMSLLMLRARLRREESRLQAQALTFSQAQLEAERANAENQRQFMDMLTHEVKTPLAVAQLCASAPASGTAYDARLRRALHSIDAVIERVRFFNLLDHAGIEPQRAEGRLCAAVAECAEACIQPERVKRSGATEAHLLTDLGLVKAVVNNLIDNALKYSPPDSPVELSLRASGRSWVVTVRNQLEPGMEFDAARLFRKYYRAPGAQRKSGSGLGLHLSDQIARRLGGQVCHRSEGAWVSFELWLPA